MEVISIRLESRYCLELERFRKRQNVRPSKTECIKRALDLLFESDRPRMANPVIATAPAPLMTEQGPLRIKREQDLPLEGVAV